MATIAAYIFSDRQSAEAAVQKIKNDIGSSSAYQCGDIVEITDECRDAQKAGEICRAYGGRPK